MNHIVEVTKAFQNTRLTPEYIIQKHDESDPEGFLVVLAFSTPEAKKLVEFLNDHKVEE